MTVDQLSLGIIAAGLVSGATVVAAARTPVQGLRVVLDFLLAAGLLRLVGPQEWSTLAVVAAVILVRQVAGRGVRATAGATWTSHGAAAQPGRQG